jgi:hypothetical protein
MGVGGFMNVPSNSRFHRLVLFCGLLLAVTSGLGAVWIFAIVSTGAGSREGNILRLGFGFLLILISLLIFATAAIYFSASEMPTNTRSDARS